MLGCRRTLMLAFAAMTKIEWLLIAAGTVALMACSTGAGSSTVPSPAVSQAASNNSGASPAPITVGAPTPVDAVRMVLPLGGPSACEPRQSVQSQMWSISDGCPVTQRLQERLRAVDPHADPICRCQNSFQVQTALLSQSSAAAQVKATFGFGGSSSYGIVFAVVHQDGRWLVDDTTCQNGPSRSIYNDPLKPCASG
jgi:hypothetical protein